MKPMKPMKLTPEQAYEGYMRAASKLAELVLSARLGVSMHPYPPERIDIPKVDWDAIRAQAEKVRNMRLGLQQDNPAIGGPKQSTCNIAHENTGGTYYCTRQAGHSGPCAAHPKTIMSFIREEN